MAAALVGTAGTVVVGGSAGASVTPGWGSGENRTAGNLLVLWVQGHSGSGVTTLPSAPSGWSVGKQQQGTTSVSATVFYKVATGGDAAPTVSGVTNVVLRARLAEFSGLAQVGPNEDNGGKNGGTSPQVATCVFADTHAGNLVVGSAAMRRTVAGTNSAGAHTFNNGASTTSDNNNATSAANHYDNAYGITTGNSAADTDSYAFTTTNLEDEANVIVSFKVAIQGAASRSETFTITAAGVRKALGTAAFSEALAIVAAGFKSTFGVVARSEVLTIVAAGVRSTFGAAALAETFSINATGYVGKFGSASLTEALTISASGTRIVLGAASLDMTLTITADGFVRAPIFGVADFPLTFAISATATSALGGSEVGDIVRPERGDLSRALIGRIPSGERGRVTT